MSVTVRSRALRDGKRRTVYLDIYVRGRRQIEYLNHYLTGNKAADREVLRLAEAIASKRRLEIMGDEHGFTNLTRQLADFVAYARRMGESKASPNTREVWRKAVSHFEALAGGPLPFAALHHSKIQEFKEYLLRRVSVNSAVVYLARIKTACRQAVNDGILTRGGP